MCLEFVRLDLALIAEIRRASRYLALLILFAISRLRQWDASFRCFMSASSDRLISGYASCGSYDDQAFSFFFKYNCVEGF